MIRRREFITLLGGAVAARSVAARAQQAERVYKIGYLQISSREQQLHLLKAFEDGLRSLGYSVGDNIVIEGRFANGELERLPSLAEGLLKNGVDIIVTGNNPNTIAAMKATATIPIVMTTSIDPVGAGLVAGLARPGGNVTGLTQDPGDEINGKRLELLRDALPNLSRVGMLWNPDFAPNLGRVKSIREAAKALGLTIVSVEARAHGLEQSLATMVRERVQAVVVLGEPVLFNYRSQLGAAALENRLSAISTSREYAEAGLLLSYGVEFQDLFRRAAAYVDRIFKGAKPSELPVEQPTKFELVLNLKTAKVLGLDVPASVLARADEVIE
jgi:putative ABC transport system substrate-binding protein